MPRTIINGNGWYLFGIANNEEILEKVDPVSYEGSALSNYIVANHSADVEYAYIVQKHNPVRAWIKKVGANLYRVYTNLLLGEGEKFSVEWFDGWNNESSTHDDVDIVANSGGRILTDFGHPLTSFDQLYSGRAGRGGLKITVTKKDSSDNVLEVLTASLEPLVVYGTTKGTSGGTVDEKYWTGEVNGSIEAWPNSGSGDYRWYRKSYGGEEERISEAGGNVYTIQGDDASKEIIVKYGVFGEGSENLTSSGNNAYQVATYQSIGAASDPFANNNWQKVIYPGGPQTWTNTTNSTLGVWVKIKSFFDTVPPKLARLADGTNPLNNNDLVGEVIVADGTGSGDSLKKQVITIPFSKDLVIPTKNDDLGDLYVNLTDFKVKIKDNRPYGSKLIDESNYKYRSSSREINPESVTVSGRNLLLTLPLYNANDSGTVDKPQIYNSIYNDDLRIKDTVHVKYVRSKGTILKDKSQYLGALGGGQGQDATKTVWTDAGTNDYGGVTVVDDNDKNGNLVQDFGYDIDESITHSLGFDWSGQITNNVTADNLAPIVRETEVDTNGLFIRIRFSEALDTLSGESESNFKITYKDKRSPVQILGGSVSSFTFAEIQKINTGDGTNTGNSYADYNPSAITLEKWNSNINVLDTIKLTLATGNKIYKHFENYANHIVTVTYDGNFLNDPVRNDVSGGNVVQTFTDQSITNTSNVNNTYPAFSITPRTHTTISGGESSNSTHHIELPKGEPIINVSRKGTSGGYKVDFTIMAADDSQANSNAYFTLDTATNVTNTDVKLDRRPTYTTLPTDITGWDTVTDGITQGAHYFRIKVTMDKANSTGSSGGAATGDTFEYITPNITLDFNHDNNLVRKKTTDALLKANKAITEGKFICYYDKYTKVYAMGPTNCLKATNTSKWEGSGNNPSGGSNAGEGSSSKGTADNMNIGFIAGLNCTFTTAVVSGTDSIPAHSSLGGSVIKVGGLSNENIATYLTLNSSNINAVKYATNAINLKNDDASKLALGGAGPQGTSEQFSATLNDATYKGEIDSNGTAGTYGNAANNFGYYIDENTSPFLQLQSKFKLFTFAKAYKQKDDSDSDILATNATSLNAEKMFSSDGNGNFKSNFGVVFTAINTL